MTAIDQPAMQLDIALTAKAAEKVREFMAADDVTESTTGLRVSVMPGGCSGFKYNLEIEDDSGEEDFVVESEGVQLFVDGFSAQYLIGTRIDYVSSMTGSGFTFNNPSATGGCGCGSSFSA